MIGTVLAFVILAILVVNPIAPEHATDWSMMGFAMIAVATTFILIWAFIRATAWGPLQKGEQNLTPRMLELYRNDRHLRYGHMWLVFFPLITFLIVANGSLTYPFNRSIMLGVWIVLLGISLDFLNHILRRTLSYFSPFSVVEMFAHEAKICVQNDREIDLCNWIDALSEVALKSISRTGSALCNQAVDETQVIARIFLDSAKSIGHVSEDEQTKKLGIHDKVSYTLFFLFQRYEAINEKAIERKLETICSNLITVLGKISIYGAKYDLSIASYPLHYLGKFATRAVENQLNEVGVKASCTLLEVAKVIVTEVNTTFSDLKDPFFSITAHLQDIAKATFQLDKNTSIKILIQPFADLKELFTNEKVASHQDTAAILQNIDRVIVEFETLEMVMRTLPPLPVIEENTPKT